MKHTWMRPKGKGRRETLVCASEQLGHWQMCLGSFAWNSPVTRRGGL